MKLLRNVYGVAIAAIALAAAAPSAWAQEKTFTNTCRAVGGGAPEPLGDREGHSISVNQASCHVDSGPMSGGVITDTSIWEWNGTNAVLLSGGGVIRKPGATLVYRYTEAKIALMITDGKVTGATGTGRGDIPIATGDGAWQAGKSFTFSFKSTGPGESAGEGKVE